MLDPNPQGRKRKGRGLVQLQSMLARLHNVSIDRGLAE